MFVAKFFLVLDFFTEFTVEYSLAILKYGNKNIFKFHFLRYENKYNILFVRSSDFARHELLI